MSGYLKALQLQKYVHMISKRARYSSVGTGKTTGWGNILQSDSTGLLLKLPQTYIICVCPVGGGISTQLFVLFVVGWFPLNLSTHPEETPLRIVSLVLHGQFFPSWALLLITPKIAGNTSFSGRINHSPAMLEITSQQCRGAARTWRRF